MKGFSEFIQFIDPDYQQFIYGLLWSAKVNKKKTYFYVILKIGNEVSDVFLNSILKEIVTDKIIAWHQGNFPYESKRPMIECITFRCDKKKLIKLNCINFYNCIVATPTSE